MITLYNDTSYNLTCDFDGAEYKLEPSKSIILETVNQAIISFCAKNYRAEINDIRNEIQYKHRIKVNVICDLFGIEATQLKLVCVTEEKDIDINKSHKVIFESVAIVDQNNRAIKAKTLPLDRDDLLSKYHETVRTEAKKQLGEKFFVGYSRFWYFLIPIVGFLLVYGVQSMKTSDYSHHVLYDFLSIALVVLSLAAYCILRYRYFKKKLFKNNDENDTFFLEAIDQKNRSAK